MTIGDPRRLKGQFSGASRQKENPWYYTYRVWQAMKARCKPGNIKLNYGLRGITVCERWENSFENFCVDKGMRPSKTHSIERIDVNGNYTPENTLWVTQYVQDRNKRNSVHIYFNGKSQIMSDWAKELAIPKSTFSKKYNKGKSIDEIIQEKTNKDKRNQTKKTKIK